MAEQSVSATMVGFIGRSAIRAAALVLMQI
jgi:hypothetical protein